MAKIGATAAAAVTVITWLTIGLFIGPASTGAVFADVLEPVVQATGQADAVHVILRMLSRKGEDFSYVNLDGDLELVEAWIRLPRVPGDRGRARINKPDRIYAFDGDETVFFHRASGTLICSDFLFRHEEPEPWATRVVMRALGILGSLRQGQPMLILG